MSELSTSKRIVIKIGSALLVNQETGTLNQDWLKSLAEDVSALMQEKREVILVSSGAIALGRRLLHLDRDVLTLEENQAAASVGQIALASAYCEIFKTHHYEIGQILLTLSDTEERRRYLNARATINTLLNLGALPIINENDSVATTEIRYGDNDRLSARVASMVSSDCLILLSDIDGLYTSPPTKDANAKHIPVVDKITPEIEAMAGGAASLTSRGGMTTKIEAAKIATHAGADMYIASGKVMNPIKAILGGEKATRFIATSTPLLARKKWILGTLEPQGTLWIDAGAKKALMDGKSLLPAGVKNLDGTFSRGDAVIIRDEDETELGRGLIDYDDAEARAILGQNTRHIEKILGYKGRAALIHRDNLVLMA